MWEEPAEVTAAAAAAVANANTTTTANTTIPLNAAGPAGGASRGPGRSGSKSSANSDVVASWRELTAANGRKYYYNAVTKVSLWEMPPEYADYLERVKDPTLLDKAAVNAKFLAMLKECVRMRLSASRLVLMMMMMMMIMCFRVLLPSIAGKRRCGSSLVTPITS